MSTFSNMSGDRSLKMFFLPSRQSVVFHAGVCEFKFKTNLYYCATGFYCLFLKQSSVFDVQV